MKFLQSKQNDNVSNYADQIILKPSTYVSINEAVEMLEDERQSNFSQDYNIYNSLDVSSAKKGWGWDTFTIGYSGGKKQSGIPEEFHRILVKCMLSRHETAKFLQSHDPASCDTVFKDALFSFPSTTIKQEMKEINRCMAKIDNILFLLQHLQILDCSMSRKKGKETETYHYSAESGLIKVSDKETGVTEKPCLYYSFDIHGLLVQKIDHGSTGNKWLRPFSPHIEHLKDLRSSLENYRTFLYNLPQVRPKRKGQDYYRTELIRALYFHKPVRNPQHFTDKQIALILIAYGIEGPDQPDGQTCLERVLGIVKEAIKNRSKKQVKK
jgi:hypothetical protein